MDDVIFDNKGYLDEKFGELRQAALAGAAATIYAQLLAQDPSYADESRREELKARAAKDAVDLYFRV